VLLVLERCNCFDCNSIQLHYTIMPPSKKKSSKKKGFGKKKAAASATASSATSTPTVPRSNEEIIGNSWKNNVIKKSIVRELNEALVYESTISEKRKEIFAQLDALNGTSVNETGSTDLALMPVTYETEGMLNYPKMPCMLTVGKTAPFLMSKRFHGVPVSMMRGAGYDEVEMGFAKSWDPKQPVYHVDLPHLCRGSESTIFMGECYLDKEDVLHFAQRFAKGASSYNWPDSFAILQCPFCCKMALPLVNGKGKVDEASVKESTYIMILQNIMQFVKMGTSLQRIHRGLPRLCCKSCFEKNLIQEEELGISYPGVLKHGIMFHAAKNDFLKGFPEVKEGDEVESISISAYSLFVMYERCGMQAAVDETIFVTTEAGMNSFRGKMEKIGIKLGEVSIKQAKAQYGEEEEGDTAERCQQVD